MKAFEHINAKSIDEASAILSGGNAVVNAGGTDLVGALRFQILNDYPKKVVNLKSIPGLDYIKEESGVLKIGAMTRLEDIAASDVVKSKYSALAQAADRTASPHIREQGTIAGNICQMNRCWYFRKPDNRFFCIRKGGNMCFAMAGDNRYHSIFGAVNACIAVNPSDTAPALVALNATIKTNKRDIPAEDFWAVAIPGSTVLEEDEIVTEIQVPAPPSGAKSAFFKTAIRKSIDFPIVNCAAMISGSDARICLNAVYNKPYRATKGEDVIKGKTINEENADAAAEAALSEANGLPGRADNPGTKYKIQIAKAMVKRAILACK
ncbi:MAG: FAD binding domain-containing protein [Dehalococcoidales bacterium]|jgi:xanthine dehydrogenase YagS FAD-binding subunit|nr:FAD binding domain-containing protein [Dehalococcoidales bacterium]